MYYLPKKLRLRDGRMALLRSPEPARDAGSMVEVLKTVCGETDFLSMGADEVDVTVPEEERWMADMNKSPKKLMILCEVEGEIAGMCHLHIGEKRREAHRGEIGISLLKKYWEQGIGTAMLEELSGVARQKGLGYLELIVAEGNDRAIALYEKSGFALMHVTPDAQRYPDGTVRADLFMRKVL